MWKKPLNSAVLVATTHRRFGETSDGISTRVVAYMINKYRAKISGKRLCNVRNPPGEGDLKIGRENTVATRTEIVTKSEEIYSRTTLLRFCQERISLHKACFSLLSYYL